MKTIEAARGKWHSILTMLGVDADLLSGKHTACPACAEGKDRFRFDNVNGNGDYICSQCGAGNGFDLLQKINGWSFKQAASEVDKVVGAARQTEIKPKQTVEQKRKRLNNMRLRFKDFRESSSVVEYLRSRGINSDTMKDLTNRIGFIQGLEYWNGREMVGRYDSMIATVTKLGRKITYHVTYTQDGKKAVVNSPRKIMAPVEKFDFGEVQLFDHSHELGVAEGIETALSAYQMFQIPTWATLTAKSLENFVIPQGVKKLHIFGDNDKSFTGQRAAKILREKAIFQGVEVIVWIPTTEGYDWNDVLKEDL